MEWLDRPGVLTVADYWDGGAGGIGTATTLPMHDGFKLPKREFPPGFAGANPGPSHPEQKPRYRVKAIMAK